MAWKAVRLTVALVILLSNLFCSLTICSAEVPWKKYSYFSNWGGLNDQLSATEIADNEASDIQNVVFDTGGAIKKRLGTKSIPSPAQKVDVSGTSVAITGLAFFKKDNGNKYVIVISNSDNGVKAKKKDYESGGGLEIGAWDEISTGSLPSTGYTNNDLVCFSIAQDKIIVTFSATTAQKPFVYDGTAFIRALTADSDCPTVSLNAYHKNHLFLSGNTTFPSRIYFSALDNITSYTATDFFDVETADGSKVRGLLSAYDSLYVFKDKSIWRLSGKERDTFILEKMVDGIGTLSQQSIKIVNNIIYFTSAQNDIVVYDGGYDVQFISQKIRNTIGGLNFARATNTLGLGFSTYKYNDHDYYCSVSNAGSSTNNRVLLFDTAYKSWSKFVGIKANAWTVAEDANGQGILVYGDYNGYVYYYPSTTYVDGQTSDSIAAFYQTKWFKYSDISLGDKYWRLLKTYTLSETTTDTFLNAECRADYEATGKEVNIDISQSGSLWDAAVWDVDAWSGSGLKIGRDEIEKGKYMFQIKYSNSKISEGFTIIGFENFIEPTERI